MKRRKLNHRRLAEGEVTGHYHEIGDGTLYLHEDGRVEVKTDGATVSHQEHGAVEVDPGVHERLIVREVNEDEEIRRVID